MFWNNIIWTEYTPPNTSMIQVEGTTALDAPYITSVMPGEAPSDGLGYETGEVITVTVTFSEAVDVTGMPRFPLRIGGSDRNATYSASNAAKTELEFTYTVQSGDYDNDGFEIRSNLFDLNGGSIKRAGTQVNADLDKSAVKLGRANSVNAVTVTGIAVVSEPAPGVYGNRRYTLGEHIEVRATFSAAVTVTGTPQLSFCLNRSGQSCNQVSANYNRSSGSTELIFRYTVQAGDDDNNGIWISDDAISLNGGTIRESGTTNAADLSHSGIGTQGSHRVYHGPIVRSVEVASAPQTRSDTYGLGETIRFRVTFSESVDVEGDPIFEFSLGGTDTASAYSAAESSATALVFTYVVQAGDDDDNGIWLGGGNRTFELDPDDSIQRAGADVDALLYHSGPGTQGEHKVDGSLDAPGPPTGLTATAVGGTRIDLSWTEPTDIGGSAITGYRIEWSADGNDPWTELVPDTGTTATGHRDTGLGSETTRHYRVFAINNDGTGGASNVGHATTADVGGPVPASASVPAAGRSLAIVFDEALDETEANLPAASRFAISAADRARFVIGSVGVSGTTVTLELHADSPVIRTDQALTVTYADRSASDNPDGVVQDGDGNDASDFTLGPGETVRVTNGSTVAPTAPGKPRNLAAEPGGHTSIVLTWDPPADTGGRTIANYRIEWSADGNAPWTVLVAAHSTMKDGAIDTRYEHTGIDPATTRHYRVRAKNAEGDGAWSDPDDATTTSGAPDAPTGLKATAALPSPQDGTTLLALSWTEPADEGDSPITGYKVEYSEDVGPLVWQELEDDTGTRATSFRDTGLGSEITRHYRVSAINDDGTSVPSNTDSATTADVAGPVPASASVPAAGRSLAIVFDEALDATSTGAPPPARFAITTADGARMSIGSVEVSGMTVTLNLHADSPTVRTGQTVTVAYADRTANDDARGVVQDDDGNDAAAFTLGSGETVTVTNGSTRAVTAPGAPAGLAAVSGGDDRIELTWTKPADTGGRAITSYTIFVSTDGGTSFDILHGSHNTMVGGEIVTRYEHTGLGVGDVRHYRVRARNGPNIAHLGPNSNTAMGVVDLKGRVLLSVDPAGVAEGGTATWTVTATTDENARPESGLEMRVRVVSEDGTATAPGDYAAVDTTEIFRPSDFAQENVDGVGDRYVARKRGTVTVAQDIEVEGEERFALAMSIAGGGTGWVPGTDPVEVAIGDDDGWGVAVAADPARIAEGETREVVLTARIVRGDGSAPPPDTCVAPFPVTVGLAVDAAVPDAATLGTDYTLDGETDGQEIAGCATDAVSWTVRLAALVDRMDDDGETVAFAPQIVGTPAIAPAALTAAAVTVRESRGVVLSRLALTVEEGGSASYTAVLTSRPTGPVRLTPRVSGDMDVTVTPSRLTFTGQNWNLPQTLTVWAAQDEDDEDETALVSHDVAGADYGANGVTAGGVRVAVDDDDKSFGVMTVRLSDGASDAYPEDPAPVAHFGGAFHITLWWSELRTHDYETPNSAIGPDRAIRVTGARVRPVKEDRFAKWTQSRLRLELTPESAGTDVTLLLEPMDCSYPLLKRPRTDPRALCAWSERGRGPITGLRERVRWTVHGIGAVPAAPVNLTLWTDEILTVQDVVVDRRQVLVASFDADRDASGWRVEAQEPGGDWSEARVRSGAKYGSRHNVRLDGLAVDGAWDVRARWENRYGAGPWAEVGTTAGPPLAAPAGLGAAQGDDGQSVVLSWTPSASAARYQYRLGRGSQTMVGGWVDIPDSGPGAAHQDSFTVHGLERTWEIKAQLRAVDRSGRAGAASAEARVPESAPRVLAGRVRVTSDPGPDGRYAVGDRIEVGVKMSRPVRVVGGTLTQTPETPGGEFFADDGRGCGTPAPAPTPTVTLDIGENTRVAALDRIETQAGTAGIGSVACGAGDTLFFSYVVLAGDEDLDGIEIPVGGLRLNGARLVEAGAADDGPEATFGLGEALPFPAHRVDGVKPQVTGVEWLGNRVWVHFERDLDPASWRLEGAPAAQQFFPSFSMSSAGDVIDARIVRGRGWTAACRSTEAGCGTVRLTLGNVRRTVPGTSRDLHGAPDPGEEVSISYVPHPHLTKYRLRDAAGNEAGRFGPMPATRLSPGADPVLGVSDAAGREGEDAAIQFTVRLIPAATSEVTVDYATADGWVAVDRVSPHDRWRRRRAPTTSASRAR